MSGLADHILSTIHLEQFDEIAVRYVTEGSPISSTEHREKYLDLKRWIEINVERVQRIGLDTGPRRRVLDLGCGCGYFLYACRLLGHEILGVDRPEKQSLYTEIREFLGVPNVSHVIKPFEPLPDLGGGRFDAVTAHMVCFNGHCTSSVWGPTEWRYLLDNLDELGARLVYLDLNSEPGGRAFTPELRDFFEDRGAGIQGHRVRIER